MPSETDVELPEAGGLPPIACAACERPIVEPYYEINRTVVCEPCRHAIERQLRGGPGFGRFARAAAFGVGAATVGTTLYLAFLSFSAYDWSVIAVLIGYLVGRMVRKGSGGMGGTAYQMLAVALTYVSLGMTYFLAAFLALRQGNGAAQPFRIAPDEALAMLIFAFQMPVLQMKTSPIHILFVGFALWEAWKLNRPRPLVVTGPHGFAPVA
jgi:hypothetical protein